MNEAIETTENHAPPAKKKARRTRRVARRPAAPAVAAKDELAGLTALDCCNACLDNMAASVKAQKRLNEIELMYPRRPAPDVIHPLTGWRLPAASVMETDDQYLSRNPQIAAEFIELGKALLGKCQISGQSGCSHPHKGGLPPAAKSDPKAVARYLRAKRALEHQKIDLRGG